LQQITIPVIGIWIGNIDWTSVQCQHNIAGSGVLKASHMPGKRYVYEGIACFNVYLMKQSFGFYLAEQEPKNTEIIFKVRHEMLEIIQMEGFV
jgi:hypothetical protein